MGVGGGGGAGGTGDVGKRVGQAGAGAAWLSGSGAGAQRSARAGVRSNRRSSDAGQGGRHVPALGCDRGPSPRSAPTRVANQDQPTRVRRAGSRFLPARRGRGTAAARGWGGGGGSPERRPRSPIPTRLRARRLSLSWRPDAGRQTLLPSETTGGRDPARGRGAGGPAGPGRRVMCPVPGGGKPRAPADGLGGRGAGGYGPSSKESLSLTYTLLGGARGLGTRPFCLKAPLSPSGPAGVGFSSQTAATRGHRPGNCCSDSGKPGR